ncbi:hypothetical protein K4L44_05675 [Halosquirtibacter laminarini]|uniref:Uncharacterized protein n=1 Tax=Halosquirtibacter laminarini TaxID=3374600 RepID=A0AC61NI20_9BACT|nr:hypothetical protein K4L44_05675 [Prolixibacteraceae bacterium]
MSINNKTTDYFNTLSPISDEKIAAQYKNALLWAIKQNDVKNIAITGSYGSGKSSILKAIICDNQEKDSSKNIPKISPNDSKNESYNDKEKNDFNIMKSECLFLSLANFCETSEEKKYTQTEIEEHILQQIFYQFSHKDLPFSKFKQIKNIKHIRRVIVGVLCWLFSLPFIHDIIRLLKQNFLAISADGFQNFFSSILWFASIIHFVLFGLFIGGCYFIFQKLITLCHITNLKKLSFKSTEVELSGNSVLNKYIEELIYFFDANEKKKYVVIEDLDRFDNLSLFTKLREVNLMINNAPSVSQRVIFIYALRDDLFKETLHRTKFFDFILPIIPIINTSNSGDKLRELLPSKEDEKDLEILSNDYINDISIFIHDLRLLKNIVNEFIIYNTSINPKHDQKQSQYIFSIIVYKNIFPNQYTLDQENRGLLYQIFEIQKQELINWSIDENEYSGPFVYDESKYIAKEEEKLREEYLLAILRRYNNLQNLDKIDFKEILKNEDKFSKFCRNQQYIENGNYCTINFHEIEYEIDEYSTYINRRKELLVQFSLPQSLSKLIRFCPDDSWKMTLFKESTNLSKEKELLALMLRKGYIDENYFHYMSYFYEGALRTNDHAFLMNVKTQQGDNFEHKLTEESIHNVVSKISRDEYCYKTTLNKQVILYLLSLNEDSTDYRLDLILRQLSNNTSDNVFEKYIGPIFNSLDHVEQKRFIQIIVEKYSYGIWKDIQNTTTDDGILVTYLNTISSLDKSLIQKLNRESDEQLKPYIEKKKDFIDSGIEYDHAINLMEALDIKFSELTKTENSN